MNKDKQGTMSLKAQNSEKASESKKRERGRDKPNANGCCRDEVTTLKAFLNATFPSRTQKHLCWQEGQPFVLSGNICDNNLCPSTRTAYRKEKKKWQIRGFKVHHSINPEKKMGERLRRRERVTIYPLGRVKEKQRTRKRNEGKEGNILAVLRTTR